MKYKTFIDRCFLCSRKKTVRYVNLYTMGSEGTLLCSDCDNKLLDIMRKMSRESNEQVKLEFVKKRELRN